MFEKSAKLLFTDYALFELFPRQEAGSVAEGMVRLEPRTLTTYLAQSQGGTMKKLLILTFAFVGACSGEIQTSPIKAGGDTSSTPPPKPTLVLSAPTTPLPYNGMAQIGWSSTGTNTCSAPWSSTTSTSGSTSLRVTKPTWFALTCTGPGGSVEDSVRIEVLPRTLRVFIYIPLQGTDGYGMDTSFSKLVIQNGTLVDSLSVMGTGSIVFSNVTADTVALTLSGNSQFPRIIAQVPKATFDSWGDTLSIIRIPRTWVVEKGMYSQMEVGTNLALSYTKAVDGTSFYPRLWIESKKGYSYQYLGWGNSSFPAKIWIDSAMSVSVSGVVPTQQDSIRLANGLATLDAFVGRTLFRFGYLAQSDLGVHAFINNGPNATGGATFDNPLGLFNGGYSTTIQSRFGNAEEAKHELFHVLGFGHTCAWPGLMQTGCVWNQGGITHPEPEKDVAFFELWQNVNDIRRKTGARIHWGENLAGTQQEAGLPVDRVVYPL